MTPIFNIHVHAYVNFALIWGDFLWLKFHAHVTSFHAKHLAFLTLNRLGGGLITPPPLGFSGITPEP